jgi:phosphohistidine swiveling domain-containing protein
MNMYGTFIFPEYIASFIKKENRSNQTVVVSAGDIIDGILMSEDVIMDASENKILYVETLRPDLVQYFKHVKGIISMQGGVLSHLAITAREHNIPVLVLEGNIHQLLGKRVVVNFTDGEIQEVTSPVL